MTFPSQDRLVRKEVALGTIREIEKPQNHIGTDLLARWREVGSDDVIFDYARGLTAGLAPARAEDAESELAQKDIQHGGTGRASVIDWALKDHYTASDVTRYREALLIEQNAAGANTPAAFPLTAGNMLNDFQSKVARDELLRRRKLDNRIEWLIMTSLETNGITYDDGQIKFTVTWDRPGGQTDQAPTGDTWDNTTADPINDITTIQDLMFDTYGIHIKRAITSRKVLNSILNSDRFAARSGIAIPSGPDVGGTSGTAGTPVDPNYLIDGWGPTAAQAVVERQTGLTFIEYDSVYRTRPVGSNTITNNRFLDEDKIFFLPDEQELDELIDDAIGFGATLTSPHPEGNWSAGYYEWEDETRDPWGNDRGSGVKAFPVFPHMELTYTATVL